MKYFQLITAALFLFSFSACRDAGDENSRSVKRPKVTKSTKGANGNQDLADQFVKFFKAKDFESAKKLLEEGVHPDTTINTIGTTVLMESGASGYSDFVKTLLSQGADSDIQDQKSKTALIYTCNSFGKTAERLIIVESLLASKANPDIKDETGSTALMYASKLGRIEIVQALLNAKADPNIQNNKGYTALMQASFQVRLNVAKALLDAGADKKLKNHNGKTAANLVSRSFNRQNQRDIDELLGLLRN